jgi:amino acid adenylation domain-containing protein
MPVDLCEFVFERFAQVALANPESLAIECGGRRLSYGELNRQADRVAARLQAMGVGPESRVGLCVERSVEMVIGMVGILQAGGAYVPLDPSYPGERLGYVIEDSALEWVLTSRASRQAVEDRGARLLLLDQESEWAGSGVPRASGVSGENLAYVIYTSGSTGRPKGVMVTHSGLANYLNWAGERYRMGEGEGTLAHSSISFDLAVTSLLGPLQAGRPVRLTPEGAGLAELSQMLQGHTDLSFLKLTPAHLRGLGEMIPAERLGGRTRALIVGGEALSAEDIAPWRTHAPGTRIINEYGPTETVVGSSTYEVPPEGDLPASVPIGRPIANTQVWILDERQRPVPIGIAGELYIGGAGVARGYLGRPGLTAERFVPHPISRQLGQRLYRTGDRVRFREDNELEFLGRSDEQVKLRGYRIELGEVEAALRNCAGVAAAAVILHAPGPQAELVAYWTAAGHAPPPSGIELGAALQQGLPAYMIPGVFVELPELPLTNNGKVDRKSLAALEPRRVRRAHLAPRTPMEELIAGIWREVLKSPAEIGVEENFFELGGHSLLATQVISRIRAAFQAAVTLPMLFEEPTIAGLAKRVEQLQLEREGLITPPIVPVPRNRPAPLSFAQQRLWFVDQLHPGNPAYNISTAVRLRGPLNVQAFERALRALIERHEILRTRFLEDAGKPVQVVDSSFETPIVHLDFTDVPAKERAIRAQELFSAEAVRPFVLSAGALLRTILVRLEDREHLFFLGMHHIIADGWSMGVMVGDLVSLYQDYCDGRPSSLPPLAIQYADFSYWQREWLQGESLKNQLRYWRTQLSDAPRVLELPTDRPRPAAQRLQGDTLRKNMPLHLGQELTRLARSERATLSMVLLGAFKVLLHHLTRLEDIVVGSNVANRNRLETENLIGFFVNQLVLKTDLSGDPTFIELLSRVRATTLGAYEHQDLPFDLLVAELQPERSMSRMPLYQVLFTLENAPMPPLAMAGLVVERYEVQSSTAKFDLVLTVVEEENSFTEAIEYDSDLFDRTTIGLMLDLYEVILNRVVASPAFRLSEIETVLSEIQNERRVTQGRALRAVSHARLERHQHAVTR